MVEVRIRLTIDAKSQHLGEVPFTEAGLNDVIALLNGWGLTSDGPDYPDLVGQFVLDHTGAYFEIVVVEDE